MECVNQNCKNRELLKKLFAGETNPELLPEFCPYCGSSVQRSSVPPENTSETISHVHDRDTGVLNQPDANEHNQNCATQLHHNEVDVHKDHQLSSPISSEIGTELDSCGVDNNTITKGKEHPEESGINIADAKREVPVEDTQNLDSDNGQNRSQIALNKTLNVSENDENSRSIKYPPEESFGSSGTNMEKTVIMTSIDTQAHDSDISVNQPTDNDIPNNSIIPDEEKQSLELSNKNETLKQDISIKENSSKWIAEEKESSKEIPADEKVSSKKLSDDKFKIKENTAASEHNVLSVATSEELSDNQMEIDDENTNTKGPSILGPECVFGAGGLKTSDMSNRSGGNSRPAPNKDIKMDANIPKTSKDEKFGVAESSESNSSSEEEIDPKDMKGATGPYIYDQNVIREKRRKRKRKKKGGKAAKKTAVEIKNADTKPKEMDQSIQAEEMPAALNNESSSTLADDAPQHGEQQNIGKPSSQHNVPPPKKPSEDEDCVKIVFHALLSPTFKFSPNKQVVTVRLGHEELGNWKYNFCDNFDASIIEEGFVSVKGEMQLPIRFVHKPIPYKYVVYYTDKDFEWEYSEFSDGHHGIVDRSLSLLNNYRHTNAVWHQYDGVIYHEPPKSSWKVWTWGRTNKFDPDELKKNRVKALKFFFPKWEGFVTNCEYTEEMTAIEAIEKMNLLQECLTHPFVSIGKYPHKKTVGDLKFNENLEVFLKPKISHNARLNEKELQNPQVRLNRLVSSLAISQLIYRYKLQMSNAELSDIIMCLVLGTNDCNGCDFDKIGIFYPENTFSELIYSIIHLMKCLNEREYSKSFSEIILAVPLLHFLRKDIKPFEKPDNTEANLIQKWCHVKDVPKCKAHPKFVQVFLPIAQPMFLMDPYFRRLFMCYVPFEDFAKISSNRCFPVNELCTALALKVKTESFLTSKQFTLIKESLVKVTEIIEEQLPQRLQDTESVMLIANSSHFLLKELLKKGLKIKEEVFFASIKLVACVLCCGNEIPSLERDDHTKQELYAIFVNLVNFVEAAVEKEFLSKISTSFYHQKDEFEVWTKLLNAHFFTEKLKDEWCERLVSLFESRLKQLSGNDAIDLFCRMDKVDEISHVIVESITDHAFTEVEKIVEGRSSEHSISELKKKALRDRSSSRAGELLSRVLLRSWKRGEIELNWTSQIHEQLHYILTWKHWPGFISSFGAIESQEILTPEAAKLLQCVIKDLCIIQHALIERTIDVKTLTSLKQHQDNFRKLCGALVRSAKNTEENQGCIKTDIVMKELEKGIKELDRFQGLKNLVGDFLAICKSSRVQFETSDLECKMDIDISNVQMINICRRDPPIDDNKEEIISVVFFDVPPSLLAVLPQLSSVRKSVIFQNLWKRNSKSAFKTKQSTNEEKVGLTLNEVQKNVWQPSIEAWEQLALTVHDGTIALRDIDKHFIKIDFTKEFETMFSSLKLSGSDKKRVMDQRLKQINQYQKLQGYIEASETIWEFKEALGLKGDFDVVAQLRDQTSDTFKGKQLDSINKRFLQAGEYLKKISIEKAHCLAAVIDCEPLVTWLRETIKDTSALSTLVDLAMISAGENDLEVDRISNFHTSCLNFAPLIFDVQEEMSFEDLMKKCQPVWNAVDSDEHLPEKLSETSRHLEWLKAVQSSHGSVEMSSLMQTKIINSSGLYVIGDITESEDINPDLESVISLTVPMDERIQDHPPEMEDMEGESKVKEEVKTYTLNDLKNLQSKLMLIAGKTAQLQNKESIESTEEINQFVEVLEGVMRLGQVYIDLCESGDVKFIGWKHQVNCHDGRVFHHRSIGDKLAEICLEMEERLEDWRKHVQNKRLKFKDLNHFTTKQILVLRRELSLLRNVADASVDTLPQHVFTLLESVNEGITSNVLIEVLNGLSGFTINAVHLSPDLSVPSFKEEENIREKYQSFFESVEKMDFEDDVGIAALKAMDIINQNVSETDLIDWCMEHGEDTEEISFKVEEARDDPLFIDLFPELKEEMQKSEQDAASDTMLSDDEDQVPPELPELDFEHPSYLSLDELGSILDKLSKRCLKPSERKFPDYLRHDQPNLVLVPSCDIFATVLSLYMQYGRDRLPTPNEVVVCTQETTAEEVELFWWRAFEDKEKQIFCLVHPDVLDYSVSQTAVNKFNLLKQQFVSSKDYRIVVMCSTENEDRSHIIAALDEYRLQATPGCSSSEVLKPYLTEQLCILNGLNGYCKDQWIDWTPAAHLDDDRLSVRVVSSDRAGVGKTLVVSRLKERLPKLPNNVQVTKMSETSFSLDVTVPLHGTVTDTCQILDALWQYPIGTNTPVSRIIHLDVSPSIVEGLETVLFNLVILGVLQDKTGRLWRRRPADLYIIELTNSTTKVATKFSEPKKVSFISLLPTIECITPRETLKLLKTPEPSCTNPLFDKQEFSSVPVQRAYQYLQRCDTGQSLDRYQCVSGVTMGTPHECLALIIKFCGIEDPSWSELKHFIDFLNSQLHDCEESYFTKPEFFDDQWMQGTLKGFKSFVVRFMVTMSRDFATPSLDDNKILYSVGLCEQNDDEDIRPLQLRRRWESSPHPYIFFNQDRITMTFLGFHVNANGDLVDPDTTVVIQRGLLTKQLQTGLAHQKVAFNTNYNGWTKDQRIEKLCLVMGLKYIRNFDPDPSYELTIDNMKKILAIHMRFRCGIPVVIMGETGCGKTRLIRYMCALQAGSAGQRNMLLMKVHGGTSYDDIKRKVQQAEDMAAKNEKRNIDTVLFFDEANTTDALGMVKEVMVDRRINGRPVGVGLRRLHFIAACNPYRKHTDKMIEKLESAGLGYNVKANETKDKLGKIPLRHLVYRVHALPASMRPLVWDFGQLKPEIEKLYIKQIVSRYILSDQVIPGNDALVNAIAQVLAAAQKHMRKQQDECSFVSLRDVERSMTVMTWFYKHYEYLRQQDKPRNNAGSDEEDSDSDVEMPDIKEKQSIDKVTWSLLMSLGVCYHAKLQERRSFRESVVSVCMPPLTRNMDQNDMLREIEKCQKVVIDELTLGPNIARNTALSENVFMMVVCIELRIPLFVIGKPGSSKSLAKTVVADNMQGDASKSGLFKRFKRAHMVSYQCSPLSTPDGIVATFRQCRRLQDNNPDDRYASVVVLDEVGLAEDSPLLPLKTLHPLLEDGVTSSDDVIETDEKPIRVAFIGISNWALDPAKMNRGLMLMRGEPNKKELEDSAWGICAEKEDVRQILSSLLKELALGYADLYKKQKKFKSLSSSKRDEFFGLRDFYSLVKMVYSIASEKEDMLDWTELVHAIRRNFGGLDEIDAVNIFSKRVRVLNEMQNAESVNTVDLLRASLDHKNAIGESRYLLVITENYSALRIVEQQLIKNKDDYVVIFGSSFPKDQEYTQVCRNINQIKVCMETGRTVVLLNLENLYESLYDALNQYYVYCAGQKYVDLGLGSHRVKCRVDDSFRLIVIAERDIVYKKFPIPLINRLEKHYLVTSKSLGRSQLKMVDELMSWSKDFATVRLHLHERKQYTQSEVGDSFIGYQSDTIPSMVLHVCSENDINVDEDSDWDEVKEKCQRLLIESATPDAIARLPKTSLKNQADDLKKIYFVEQEHSSLSSYLGQLLTSEAVSEEKDGLLVQVTTHSRLLSENDLHEICQAISFERRDMELLYLQQFQTEQQFVKQVRDFFIGLSNHEGILLVQCDSGDENFNLIACTRHLLMDQRVKRQEMLTEKLEVQKVNVNPVHVVVIVQLPRQKGGCANFVGFQGGQWNSVHVDDLRPPSMQIPPIEFLIDRPISDLLKPTWLADDKDVEIDTELSEQGRNLSLDEIDVEMSSEEEIEIDLDMDVDMDVKETHTREESLNPQQVKTDKGIFDAIVLIRRSVQAAAGRLEDDSVMANRTTERIDRVLNLLPENSSKMSGKICFAKTLHQKIYELLLEKNETITGDLAREWVRIEALSGTRMHERGTFRKALQHKVLTEIEPLLAKILAFADRDCNLDLLDNKGSWLSRLWIQIFDNKQLNEKYYEFSNSNKIREHVHVSGRGRHVFSCRFPFSWLIKEVVDALARGAGDVSDRSGGTEEEKLRRIIGSSDLSEILSLIKEEEKEEEAAMRYLHDFVHMVYYPNQQCEEQEIELVCRFIRMAAEDNLSEEEDDIFDFATIHVTFHRVQTRINSFNQLIQSEPGITRLLLEKKIPLAIDVAALLVCLEELEALLMDLRTDENRNLWCSKVLVIRSSIEAMTSKEVFAKDSVTVGRYEESEKETLRNFWIMWQRLSVIRLFITHVCNTSLQNDVAIAYINKLSKVLEDNSNFLTTRSVRSLEKFLLECRQDFSNRIRICDTICSICMDEAKRPILTPCGHCFCYNCVTHWCSDNQTCPKCREPLPAGFQPKESEEILNTINTLTYFRNQCVSFFMEVVSLFCFGYSPCGSLEEDTYKLLMSYVTGEEGVQTKPFSPFSDTLDVTPVVRSFLLQQLLKSSDRKVKEYMELFIGKAQQVVQVEDGVVDIFALCIQCMEDAKNNNFMKRASGLALDHKLHLIGKHCQTASTFWSGPQRDVLDAKWLEGVAGTRFSLSLAADLMYEKVDQQDNQDNSTINIHRALDGIFSNVEKICTHPSITTPRLFLLKQFSRKYGFESISVLAQMFAWILPPEVTGSIEVSQDRFLVYGQNYQTLRETVAKSVVTGDMSAIDESLQNLRIPSCVKNVTLLLGIFQEITANPSIPISDKVMEHLKQFIGNSTLLNDDLKRLAQDLTAEGENILENSIRNLFALVSESNTWHTSMAEIIIHLAALLFSKEHNGLLGPLVSLAVRPSTCANSFLPTMPDDRLQDVRSAVAGRLYECPNGHPYLVTECGRPVERSRCRAPGCGADIGGVDHQPVRGNVDARTTDQTKTGHCLGDSGNREQVPISERNLSSLATCLIRLLVHGSMLVGSCYQAQVVAQLISPAINFNTVRRFLWDHVITDMRLLSRVCGRSVDETALIVHLMLRNISSSPPTPEGPHAVLQNKLQRNQWETKFMNSVIKPLFSNLAPRLQETVQLIANDKRFGANPLLRQLYELESGVEDYEKGIQPRCSALWRYRTPITLDHVTRKFNEVADTRSADCAIFGEFLKQEHELRAVRFLPDVVKLQQLLMDRYHRSLDKTETDNLKLKDLYKQIPRGQKDEYKSLVQSFKSAWNIMSASLKEKGTKGSLKKLSEHKVEDSSPISMFIPSSSGMGLCSLELVGFLVRTNNEFLELYSQHSEVSKLQHVNILEVTHSQLVSYEADRDLLPLVHAHCHYSLEVGQGTQVEYDWSAIQRHLIDRLIRGRSVVDFKNDEYTKTAVVNSKSVLTSLKAKIPQVELSSAIQHQIIHQYRSLQDVCEALSSLNIAITFLSSGGGRPNMKITKYLHEVLKLPDDAGLRNHKVQEVCQLQHSVSLWRLLSLERAKLLTRSDKDPFEHLPKKFKDPLADKLKLTVNSALRKLSEASVDALVSVIMELITLHLNDEYDMIEYSLKDYILYQQDSEPMEDVEKIPEGVLLTHVFSFWKLVLGFSDRCHTQRIQATG